MWFVWDGKARQGPFSEAEICRRIATGQWPLSVWVRPEGKVVFRPALWMVQEWSAKFAAQGNRATDFSSSTFHEETKVSDLNRPVLAEQGNEAASGNLPPAFNSNSNKNAHASTFTSPQTVQSKTVTSPTMASQKKTSPKPEAAADPVSPTAPDNVMSSSVPSSQADPYTFRPEEGPSEEATRTPTKQREKTMSPDTAVEMAMIRNNVHKESSDQRLSAERKSQLAAPAANNGAAKAQAAARSRFAGAPPAVPPGPPAASVPVVPSAPPQGTGKAVVPSSQSAIKSRSKNFEPETHELARNDEAESASDDSTLEVELKDSDLRSSSSSRNRQKVKPGTQKPLVASEGSVNLIESSSATQIRLRRVNPTAPRRKTRNLGPQLLSKIPIFAGKVTESRQSLILLSVVFSLVLTLICMSAAYFFFFRKSTRPFVHGQEQQYPENTSSNSGTRGTREADRPDERRMEGTARSERGSERNDNRRKSNNENNRTIPQQAGVEGAKENRRKNNDRTERAVTDRKGSGSAHSPDNARASAGRKERASGRAEMSARQDPYKAPPAKPKVSPSSAFASVSDIERYLQTTNPDLRGAVVIGPVLLIEKPNPDCQPCLGRGRLQDGTVVVLRSVLNTPWEAARASNVVLVKGFVFKTGTISINVNSMTKSEPR
ncbi:MAG: hypothetical protein RIR26_473 [Pseudomonadota bacterium]|jgi:hypothetical protein